MKIDPAECKLFGRIQTPSESEHSNRVNLICIEYLLNIKVIKNVSFIKPSLKRVSNDFSFPIFSQLFDYLRRHAWVVVHFWEYDKMEVKLSTLKWVRRKFLNTILFQENFPLTPTLIYFCIDMGAERRGGIRCFYFTISRIPNIG